MVVVGLVSNVKACCKAAIRLSIASLNTALGKVIFLLFNLIPNDATEAKKVCCITIIPYTDGFLYCINFGSCNIRWKVVFRLESANTASLRDTL